MKKQITILLMLFFALVTAQVEAQPKQVLYLNNATAKVEPGTSVPGDDPITRMLNADVNFVVTTGTIDGLGVIVPSDLSPYDLIIIQENVTSSNASMKPGGALSLANIGVPVIYCKSEAFRSGKAITSVAAGIDSNKSEVSVTVDVANQSNALFSGIDFSGGDDVTLFFQTAEDNGRVNNNKTGIKVLNNLEIGDAAGGTLARTPNVTDVATSVVINHIPANTKLGTDVADVASVDIIIFAFGYGPQVRGDGANITSEALTIWRNAAYVLTGQTVPTTLYENTQELSKVLYLNNANSQVEPGTSVPGYDAITRMLDADANFEVTVGTIGGGVVTPSDLSPYDLIIIQESVSSGDATMVPGGALSLAEIKVPVIYCKSEAFRGGKAVTTGAGINSNTSEVSVIVDVANQSNALFSGIDFSGGDDVRLFLYRANGNGAVDNNGIGLKVLNNLEIGDVAGGTLARTVDVDVADVTSSVVINHIPADTKLGSVAADKASVDIIILAFGYGPQVRGDGKNITSEALTIWRNAAYVLTDKTVPTTLFENTEEAKRILYVNKNEVGQGPGASAPGQDPVISMLLADANFYVEYVESDEDGTEIPDLSGFDLVIAQETFGSGANVFKPGGVLSVGSVTIPIIYNKNWAFNSGKAVTDADVSITGTQNVSVTATLKFHALFNGIDFSEGNDIRIFGETAGDDGTVGTKSIDVVNDLDISPAGLGALATVSEATSTTNSLVINHIVAGTQLGTDASDVLAVDAVTLPFNYGAMIMGDGTNITPEALTIWRNAAYLLIYGDAGVPTTLVENPLFTLGVEDIDKAGEVSSVSSNLKAYGNRVFVSDVKATTEVNIYSLSGALVKSFKTNEDVNFTLDTGLWIGTVKTFEGIKAVKFIVK